MDPLPPETRSASPEVVLSSPSMTHELGIEPIADEANVFAGHCKPSTDTLTYAQRYGGGPAAMGVLTLGDGRVIALGELAGKYNARWELTLKGAGPTPFRRAFDGRAVLRSCLREFILSEALHAIGVPTQRGVAVVTTGEKVARDKMYTGNPREETGAVSVRALFSWLRIGTFELPASQGEIEIVQKLVDYAVDVHMNNAVHARWSEGKSKAAAFLEEVSARTARLMARASAYGFCNGVLNTDNFSILGYSIDYGPSAFMEHFQRTYSPFFQDAQAGGNYSWERQKEVGRENCLSLAKALFESNLITREEAEYACSEVYSWNLDEEDGRLLRNKLGLREFDAELASDFFALMESSKADFTLCFRLLMEVDPNSLGEDGSIPEEMRPAFVAKTLNADEERKWQNWLHRWAKHAEPDRSKRRETMRTFNPRVVPRQHLLLEATIAAEEGDYSVAESLLKECMDPFAYKRGLGKWERPADPEEAYAPGVGLLTCSS